jgi:hypothetical protein
MAVARSSAVASGRKTAASRSGAVSRKAQSTGSSRLAVSTLPEIICS